MDLSSAWRRKWIFCLAGVRQCRRQQLQTPSTDGRRMDATVDHDDHDDYYLARSSTDTVLATTATRLLP